ncbi:pilus assembly protein [Herbaspirillum sp. LeCh32-8]|uniref:pilus assembly PilX family protein n=1 Tax=Herbaspirillum sp. LeCh32-8 TaxID=2821356 RepID=UPI001AE8A9DD|nr:PilX N-terminal domain-containing pilus assembly protein [Herbaspirillum sp. LeCh32-8]MBP0597608.1 pilus assembly protein [Herbaspirillum sp. LeCh32-8]
MNDDARKQQGAALVIALVMLAVILLLGTATASLLALDEHAGRNHRAHLHAMLAAQAALDDACEDIRGGVRVTPAAFPGEPGCRSDAAGLGLCRAAQKERVWEPRQLTADGAGAATYGEFTGRRLRLYDVAPPRYLIELLPAPASTEAGNKDDASGDNPDDKQVALYRISAAGFGPGQARAGLQAVVRRQTIAGGQVECRRLAWRPLPLP